MTIDGGGHITAHGAGSVIVNGMGGTTTGDSNYGVHIESGSAITSSGGDVSVTGKGGGTGISVASVGVWVDDSAIMSGGDGTVTVDGRGGEGAVVTITGMDFTITYVGGDGNDVVLVREDQVRDPGVVIEDRTLLITGTSGTSGRDRVIIHRRNGFSYLIRSNTIGNHKVDPDDFDAIDVQLGDGNDRFNALGRFEVPLIVDAGAGNDRIIGSRGGDVLLGGPGNDYIRAGSGNNVIIGGTGRDFLFGGSGTDILIGGATLFDYNTAALRGIQDEWNSGADLAGRVQNLSNFDGTGGGGANGTNYLQATAGAGQTVSDDDERDLLFGGGNIDWLFFEAGQDIGYVTIGDLLGDDLDDFFAP